MLQTLKSVVLAMAAIITPVAMLNAQGLQPVKRYREEKWRVQDPFEQKVFIENNEGQFDSLAGRGTTILYYARITGVDVYFTPSGLVYRYAKYPVEKEEPDKEENSQPVKPQVNLFREKWEGSNKGISVIAKDEVRFYYTYGSVNNHTTIAHAFRKLLYKNIYPGIDIEYSFKPGKKGLEYVIIVHPGASLSKVKLVYKDSQNIIKDNNGSIRIESTFGEFISYAPSHTFYKENDSQINCEYSLTGDEISFNAGSYDHTKTLEIDPWNVNPKYSFNFVYDLDYDYAGNVYAYGSFNHFQLAKVNSAGVLQWVYTATDLIGNYYGDLAVDKVTGESYISEGYSGWASGGVKIDKINTLGAKMATYPGTPIYSLEIWRMQFDMCNRTLIAGCGANNTVQACIIDTNMTKVTAVNVLSSPTNWHDVALLGISPAGDSAYMAIAERVGDPTFNNVVLRCPEATLSPTSYITADGYGFKETHSVEYIGYDLGAANGMNGMAVSYNWFYTYDGGTIKRLSKQTGNAAKTLTLSGTLYKWGGLDVDGCDNLFVGKHDSIDVFDSSFTQVATIPLGDTVYDVHLDENNKSIYSCGQDFIESDSIPIIVSNTGTFTKTVTSASCGKNNGKASASFTLCGNPVVANYLWSDGTTGQVDSGLTEGVYTVTATISCAQRYSDTIRVGGSAGDSVKLSIAQTNIKCYGDSSGSATVTATGGKPPYSYNWAPNGSTAASVSNLSAGTYQVTVSDSVGCNSAVVTITQPLKLNPGISQNDVLCNGEDNGMAKVLVSGGASPYTYNWAPTGGTSDSLSNLSAGTYVISITDSNGCMNKDSVTITQPAALSFGMTSNNVSCYGKNDGSDTLNVSGGTSPYVYTWSNGGTNASESNLSAGKYVITITDNNGCTSKDSVIITQPSKIVPSITGNDTICLGKNETLTGSGGGAYLWSNGSTSSTITVSPVITTTYTLQVTNGACNADTIFIVNVKPGPVVKSGKDTICNGDSATLTAYGGTSYQWLSPLSAKTSSVTVKPVTTTKYSVIVTGSCGIDTLSCVVNVLPLPGVDISGNTTICSGQSTTLTASGGLFYSWSPGGGTSSSFDVTPTSTTTYTLTISNGKCSRDTTIKVIVNMPPVVTITNSQTICPGDSVVLTATGGGTYTWSTGATTNSIKVAPTSDVSYFVVVSNGCPDSVSTNVYIDNPNLNVCCNDTIQVGDTVVLEADGSNNYSWVPNAGLSCNNCPNPVASPSVTTTYTVLSSDSAGCTIEKIVTVYVESPCMDFIVPNIFTPNNDGKNDDFVIKAEHTSSYSISIYDRWGKVVYSSTSPYVYWDGNINNGNYSVPDGVYYYIIKATCGKNSYLKKGYVHILR